MPFLCSGAILLGATAIVVAELRTRAQVRALHWPKTTGTIVQADLGSRLRSRGKFPRQTDYYATVSYTYLVNEQRYVAHEISLWNPDLAGDGKAARAFLAAHPPHSSVEVYYDPSQPGAAVLTPGIDESGRSWTLWSGVGLLLVGMWCFVQNRRSWRKARANPMRASTEADLTRMF